MDLWNAIHPVTISCTTKPIYGVWESIEGIRQKIKLKPNAFSAFWCFCYRKVRNVALTWQWLYYELEDF